MGRQSRQARRAQERRQAAQRARHPQRSGINWSIVGPSAAVALAIIAFIIVLIVKQLSPSTSTASGSNDNIFGTPLPPAGGPVVGDVHCGSLSMSPTYHVHAHLSVFVKGKAQTTTTTYAGHDLNGDCLYWEHAHDTTGIIHIEAPHKVIPTLGDWYRIEQVTKSPSKLWQVKPAKGETRRVWVNLKPYKGDPMNIKLTQHTDITIEFGPPFQKPKPFQFTQFGV